MPENGVLCAHARDTVLLKDKLRVAKTNSVIRILTISSQLVVCAYVE